MSRRNCPFVLQQANRWGSHSVRDKRVWIRLDGIHGRCYVGGCVLHRTIEQNLADRSNKMLLGRHTCGGSCVCNRMCSIYSQDSQGPADGRGRPGIACTGYVSNSSALYYAVLGGSSALETASLEVLGYLSCIYEECTFFLSRLLPFYV